MNMNEMKTFIRLPAVMAAVGLRRTAIYQAIKAGTFPAAIRIGPQAVAWDSGAIAQWQAERIAQSAVKSAQKDQK
ncbi:helix-turn-helix transcriptional regulator [Duganella phyllosphaerae]|uniref:Prophage CP4-57 regulatory protein AlpA n=1 Tax=Duganella phyllosphaerae TaxID=762836 RepID=A0A1E7W4N2_9BURK|nr:AlpA family phage regulatory protein [Duganella phyllosphaerae]OEZ90692.1 prophage CP4-57 regulatory protein AlpA [Duganella phyllosphaerae]